MVGSAAESMQVMKPAASKVSHASSVSGSKPDVHAVPSPLVASTKSASPEGGLLLGVRGGALSADARQEGHRDDSEGGLTDYWYRRVWGGGHGGSASGQRASPRG